MGDLLEMKRRLIPPFIVKDGVSGKRMHGGRVKSGRFTVR
jgi:hypothetical protein